LLGIERGLLWFKFAPVPIYLERRGIYPYMGLVNLSVRPALHSS
jgi:hypothetical protein